MVQIWSRNTPEFGVNKTLTVHRVVINPFPTRTNAAAHVAALPESPNHFWNLRRLPITNLDREKLSLSDPVFFAQFVHEGI